MKIMKLLLRALPLLALVANVCAAPVDELVTAVRRDSDSSVKNLLEQGVNPNDKDEKGQTALTVAIQEQSGKALKMLLNWKGTDLNATNRAGETPLMMAIISQQTELAKTLIAKGAATNKAGWSPLHYAATRSNIEMMQLLLEKDAYIDSESPNNTTPLMMTAQYGNESAIKYLISQGADPWAKNQLGLTALDFAKNSGIQTNIDAITTAQKRRKYQGPAQPLVPLSPASAAELKGEPIPE